MGMTSYQFFCEAIQDIFHVEASFFSGNLGDKNHLEEKVSALFSDAFFIGSVYGI